MTVTIHNIWHVKAIHDDELGKTMGAENLNYAACSQAGTRYSKECDDREVVCR